MRFKVPQFIDIEDKIFGPFTFRQFVYLAGGAGVLYLCFRFLPFLLAGLFGLPLAGFAVALAFYRVNDRPFITLVEAFFRYQIKSKLYLWHKTASFSKDARTAPAKLPLEGRSTLTESKLKTLSWSLDVIDTNKEL